MDNPFEQITERLNSIDKHLAALAAPKPESPKVGFLSRKQVAKLLGVTLNTVNNRKNDGTLKPYYVSGRTLFKESEVLAAVDACAVK